MFTLSNVKRKFNEYNAKYFNNELPAITIKTPNRKTRRLGGCFQWKVRPLSNKVEKEIRIYDLMDSWEKTVLHEMIHYYLFMKHVDKALNEYLNNGNPQTMRTYHRVKRLSGHTSEFHMLLNKYWNMEMKGMQVVPSVPAPAPVRKTVQEVMIGSMVETAFGLGKVVRKMLDNGKVLVYAELANGNQVKHYPA